MPAKEWHHATVRDKGEFLKDSYATITLKGVKGIQLTSGKLKKDGSGGPLTAQRYLFDKTKWTESQAKSWLKKHKIKTSGFEAAKEVKETMNVQAAIPSFDIMWNRAMKKPSPPISEQKVVLSTEGDEWFLADSFEDISKRLRNALTEDGDFGDYPQILGTYSDRVYIETWIRSDNGMGMVANASQSEKKWFEIYYDFDEEGEIIIGDSTEIVKRTQFLVKEAAEAVLDRLFRLTPETLFEALTGVSDLPDSSFGFIEPGGEKDDEGKTAPRKLRHYPMKDKNGNWEKGNVVNALTRLTQSSKSKSPWMTDAAKSKIMKMIKAGYKALELEFPKE